MVSNIFNTDNFKALLYTAKNRNLSTLLFRSMHNIADAIRYPHWYNKQLPSQSELKLQQTAHFPYNPLFSIVVPTYCTPQRYLIEMLNSVLDQTYQNWELCIADASPEDSDTRKVLSSYESKDKRIHILYLTDNKGISDNTNQALALSSGEWIGLLDHDDILAPDCLYEIIKLINEDSHLDVIYTDEDKIDETGHSHFYPHFKPDYNYLLLQTHNYICHFFSFRRDIYEKTGAFRAAFDGSQDYDFILRAAFTASNIGHIPKMLYHWRVHKASTAGSLDQKAYCYDAGRNALIQDLERRNINGMVKSSTQMGFYHIDYEDMSPEATRILFQDEHFTPPENAPDNFQFIEINRYVIQDHIQSPGVFTIFLGKGITRITTEQLIALTSYLQLPEIYASTCRVTFKNRIQSMGAFLENNCITGCYNDLLLQDSGYYGRAFLNQYIPICTGTIFACRTEILNKLTNKLAGSGTTTVSMADLALLLTLSIAHSNGKIAGIADIHIRTMNRYIPQPSSALIKKYRDKLLHLSGQYTVPPYYH